MNVNPLQPPPQPQLQRTSKAASEKDAEFLALRLLNKRSRLRLSPQPIDLSVLPGKPRLFAVANRAGWFAAAIQNTDGSHALALSPLADLHAVFSTSSSNGPLSIHPRVSLSLPAIPHIVVFTHDDARLLVAFTNGPLSVYDAPAVFLSSGGITPLHTFPFTSRNQLRDILPSPGDAAVVALLRETADNLPVEMIDVHKMATVGGWSGTGSSANPISLSWSPKGKLIAIGLESGDIVTFSPTDTSTMKAVAPRPQGLDGQSVISMTWLSNTEFHTIYAPAGQIDPEAEQSHYLLFLDSKAKTAGDVKLTCPYLAFPGLRPPGAFVVTLRGWEPSRLLLFVGDSTSSDIGLIGALSEPGTLPLDSWYNLTLEETSTPSVPLDADMNETVLLGLELDLTNREPFKYTGASGEELDVPPPPIMYLYASDGTLTGWHIIQTQGRAYPGMNTPSASPASISPAVSTASNPPPSQSPFVAATPSPSLANSFGPTATTSSAGFGAFSGAPAKFGSSTFGFGSPSSSNPPPSQSPFAAATLSPNMTNAFGTTATASGTSTGFGAFSGAPAKFGSNTFGFGSPSPTQPLQAPPLSAPSVSVEMASATEDDMGAGTDGGFSGMSLGGSEHSSESSQAKSGGGIASMFGSFGTPQQQQSVPSSNSPFATSATASPAFATFGAGPIKPGTGFGAFGGSGPSAFGSASTFGGGGAFSGAASAEMKPASGFGQPSISASAESPATPVSSAATTPAAPVTDYAVPATSRNTPSTPAFGGAFGGLATSTGAFPKLQSGFGAFGSTTPNATPFSQKPSSSTQASVAFGQTSFGAAKTEVKDGTTKSAATFGSPSPFGQSSFFGKSSFSSSPSPFAKPATSAITSSNTTTTGAFSAFSNTTSPFAAAAGAPKKSFGEMLREKDSEAREDDKTIGTSKTADEWKKPVSVFASLKQAATSRDEDEEDEGEEAGNTSFRSQDDDDEGSDLGDDGIDDFLKSDDEEEGGVSEEEEEVDEETDAVVQSQTPPESPTAKQPAFQKGAHSPFVGGVFLSKDAAKPSGSSSSSTPAPAIKVEPESPKLPPPRHHSTTPPSSPPEPVSPPASEASTPDGKGKAPTREASTTPPGSPASTSPIAGARATSAPPASSLPPTPTSGLLGAGRASTRPTRSSPLASEPISGDDRSDEESDEQDEGGQEDREKSPHKKARSASPVIPTLSGKGTAQSATRPKTPPLLFGLGGTAKPPSSSPFTLTAGASSPVFGVTASTPPAEPPRPSPLANTSSLKGPGAPGTSIFSSPPVFSPPTVPQGAIFGQKPTMQAGSIFGETPAVPTSGPFGDKAAPPTSGLFGQKPTTSAFGSPGLLSKPLPLPIEKTISPAPSMTVPSATPATKPSAPPFGSSNFGFGTPVQSPKPPASGGGAFGIPSKYPAALSVTPPSVAAPSTAMPPAVPTQPLPPVSQAAVAQGMQSECLYLFSSLGKELEDLKALAKRANTRATQLNKPGSGNKTAKDLEDPTKWILGDLAQFKEIMKEVERELATWEKGKATYISSIRELESDMLKATTRKEEIARFHRASQDTEFARMLKARTLSPDHLETQAQLRREIRTMRGRIQQLEDHIQASKKTLSSLKNGKPSIKPPSLDTINRTYRNIDIAIGQEEGDVSSLAARVTQLELTSSRGKLSFSTPSTRDKRLPDRTERIGREVTPNIAASTAAALNAERSAQKLKRALLEARKEPLLNTKAIDALPPPREVRTPRKPLLAPGSGLGVSAAFAAGMSTALPSAPGLTPPVWTPPPPGSFGPPLSWSGALSTGADSGSPTPRLGAMRGGKEKQHQKSVHAGQGTTKPAELPPPPGFSWGPLPKFDHAKQTIPGFTVFSTLKVETASEPEVKVKEEEKDLGSSWIADGFGASMT
ncbi:hypothetical protein BC628DRAFT_1492442 [Trametes gibbosa]|nr:hypothetical protein BC628DRAFT_1492442 [Trametes gibbosa]